MHALEMLAAAWEVVFARELQLMLAEELRLMYGERTSHFACRRFAAVYLTMCGGVSRKAG